MADQRTFVIIGASLAGAKAAERLREQGFTGRPLLVGAEPDRGYELRRLLQGFLRGQVLVVGAGWIGLETAAAAREHGASVTVVETDTLPLRRVLGDEVAAVFRDVHTAHGVTFHFDAGVREFGEVGGQVTHAVLADGT